MCLLLLKAVIEIFGPVRMNTAIQVILLSSSDILALGGGKRRHPGVRGICYDLKRQAIRISLSSLEMCGTCASAVNRFSSNFLTSLIILSQPQMIFNIILGCQGNNERVREEKKPNTQQQHRSLGVSEACLIRSSAGAPTSTDVSIWESGI